MVKSVLSLMLSTAIASPALAAPNVGSGRSLLQPKASALYACLVRAADARKENLERGVDKDQAERIWASAVRSCKRRFGNDLPLSPVDPGTFK